MTEQENPLIVGPNVISPVLHPAVAESAGVPFYFVAYTDKAVQQPPNLTIEFLKDGQAIGHSSPDVGVPGEDGRIQYVGTIPTATLKPGEYTAVFQLQQGPEVAQEAGFFVVQ